MKIVVAYTTVCNGPITDEYVARFVATYREYPPGTEHDTLVISNGGPTSTGNALMLAAVNARMFVRSNDGWDIGGYLEAAKGPCREYDAMLCLGESCYFHRAGWLSRMVEAWEKFGPGMYGPFSSNAVAPHLNTTAFLTAPLFLAQYPRKVSDRWSRYDFEHRQYPFWRYLERRNLPVRLVTWDGEWEPRLWRMPRNILWRGDQTNCLMWCNHSDGYANANRRTKAEWSRRTDAPFR